MHWQNYLQEGGKEEEYTPYTRKVKTRLDGPVKARSTSEFLSPAYNCEYINGDKTAYFMSPFHNKMIVVETKFKNLCNGFEEIRRKRNMAEASFLIRFCKIKFSL